MKINSILKRAFILNPEPIDSFLSISVSIQQIAILSLGNFPKNLPFLLGSFLKGIFRSGGRTEGVPKGTKIIKALEGELWVS